MSGLVARARDCKSPTKKHRRFDSYLTNFIYRGLGQMVWQVTPDLLVWVRFLQSVFICRGGWIGKSTSLLRKRHPWHESSNLSLYVYAEMPQLVQDRSWKPTFRKDIRVRISGTAFWLYGLVVMTPPCHGGSASSILARVVWDYKFERKWLSC